MACPQGPTYSTYWVRVPASGVGYVPRTVAPQANCDARGFFDGEASALGASVVYTPGSDTSNKAAVHFLRSTYDKDNDNTVATPGEP